MQCWGTSELHKLLEDNAKNNTLLPSQKGCRRFVQIWMYLYTKLLDGVLQMVHGYSFAPMYDLMLKLAVL
jgi:hypothetical protein